MQKAFGTANEGIATLVEAKELIGGASNADADGFPDGPDGMACFAQPERSGGAEVEAVVAAVDLKSGGEASGSTREIKKPGGPAVALQELDAIQGFEGANEDCGGGSGRLAHDIEHEVRAIVEENIGMTGAEIHRTDARSRAAEMMSGGIARRIRFRFHDTAAEAARREIVDDDFSDEETSEPDSFGRKFGAAKAADGEFRRRILQSRV